MIQFKPIKNIIELHSYYRGCAGKIIKMCVSRAKHTILLVFSLVFKIVPHSNDDLAPPKVPSAQ